MKHRRHTQRVNGIEGSQHCIHAAFAKVTRDPDFFVGIPTAVKIAPTQARGISISEIVRRLAPKGLMCGGGEVAFTFEGNGPMASLARKMPAKLGIQYQAYSDDLISKEAFLFLQSTGWSGSNLPIVCKRGELQRARDGSQAKKKPT